MPIWLFAIGVIHTPLYPFALPSFVLFIFACFLGSYLYLSKYQPFVTVRRCFLVWPMCFLLGTALGSFQLNKTCNAQLAPEFDGQKYNVRFQVASLPQVKGKSVSFIANVLNVGCLEASEGVLAVPCPNITGQTVRLSWYYTYKTIKAGQVWEASVKLKRPRGFVNFKSFDYQAWLLSQGVVATGYVRQNADFKPQLIREEGVWGRVRQDIKEHLLQKSERRFDRFWAALLVGDRSSMTQEDWGVLQGTGTVHLMAISGLHIGLVAWLCFGVGSLGMRFWSVMHKGSGVFAYQFVPPVISISGAFYYAALAGFSIPTLRAVAACLLVNVCIMVGVRLPAFTMVGICVAVLGVIEPLVWVNNGFWLSFVAVGILVFSMGGRKGGRSWWAWLKIQLVLSVGMMLPLVFIGQGFSVVGPIANLIAVPVLSLIVVPVLLFASMAQFVSEPLAQWVLQYLDNIFSYLWALLVYLNAIPFARWWPPQALNFSLLILGFIGSLLLLSPMGLRVRALGFIWLLCAGWSKLGPSEDFRLTAMDVGQGLSVVVNTPEMTWVYDTGPKYTAQFDAGSRIIAPYLRTLGVGSTSLIVSHDDADHSGGTQGLINTIAVDEMYYGEVLASVDKKGVQCEQGQSWQRGFLHFDVLWPPKNSGLTSNRASCVIHLVYEQGAKKFSVLFAGDIDRFVEQRILDSLPASVDVLIAPHHGSNTSSSQQFIDRLNPKHVIFSAGYKNRYHHPSKKVVSRYQQSGVSMHNTATDGAISFVLGDKAGGLRIEKARVEEAKLWYLVEWRPL